MILLYKEKALVRTFPEYSTPTSNTAYMSVVFSEAEQPSPATASTAPQKFGSDSTKKINNKTFKSNTCFVQRIRILGFKMKVYW